jgi:hypothetical protein
MSLFFFVSKIGQFVTLYSGNTHLSIANLTYFPPKTVHGLHCSDQHSTRVHRNEGSQEDSHD